MQEIGKIKCFLLDMDGTINLGQKLLPGAKDFINYLIESGRDYLFLTNNSSKDTQHYVHKMRNLGIPCDEDHMLTSGEATIIYLKDLMPNPKVYLMGTPELQKEFEKGGITLTDIDPDFVVLGFDMTLTYEKLVKGCDFIRNGVKYIATHPDFNCPVETGFIPDAGAMIELIKASTGKTPFVVGKPNAAIIKSAFEKKNKFKLDEFAMVGDRVYTDIKTGVNAGISSVLVLSGESTVEDLKKNNVEATYIFNGVGDIYNSLKDYDEKHRSCH